EAHVTVPTAVRNVRFAEVVEQVGSAAGNAFTQGKHVVQVSGLVDFQLRVTATCFDKAALLHHVCETICHPCFGGKPVSARPSRASFTPRLCTTPARPYAIHASAGSPPLPARPVS